MNIEQSTMTELPAMPPPSFAPIYLLVSYYIGPGSSTKTWKVLRREFNSSAEAEIYADRLSRWNIHRRIVRIG